MTRQPPAWLVRLTIGLIIVAGFLLAYVSGP